MARVVEVIEARRWRHTSGRIASLYGAAPGGDGWTVETYGFTWKCADGTIGLGRFPVATREEAEAVMARVNALYRTA